MTITTNDTRDEYTASAGQTVFNYTFKIFADTDLNVYQTPSGQTANDTTDLITDYTVTGVGATAGGTITLTTAASAGDLITIVSNIPDSRTTDYQYDGDFIPDVVNDDFDRVVSLVKQVNDRANRGLAFQESEQGSSGFTLPQPMAGYYVRWNGTLDGFENVPFTTTDPGAPSLTVATLANVTDADTGDWRYVQGYSTVGDGGHGVWVLTAGNFTTELAADTLNGVYLEYSGEDGSTRAWVRQLNGHVYPEYFGAVGGGVTDDRAACQAAIDSGYTAIFTQTYGIGDSGSTIPYRGVTNAKAGLILDDNQSIITVGKVTFNVVTADVIPITANAKTNIIIGDCFIDGDDSLGNSSGDHFGIYLLDCSFVKIGKIDIRNCYSNTLEVIGCTDVEIDSVYSLTTTATSIGGGPQFEDCERVTCRSITGSTKDDLVSVISHFADTEDMKFISVKGKSEEARTFYIGLSNTATGQYTMSNIVADVISRDSGTGSTSPAFSIFRDGIYKNIRVKLTDYDSYLAARINPFNGVDCGELYNSTFDITSYNARTEAVEINHNGDSACIMKNNTLRVRIYNPNADDDASNNTALQVRSGDRWDMDVQVFYPSGKTNVGDAVIIGDSDVDSTVTNSTLKAVVTGGRYNINVVRCDGLNIDAMMSVPEFSTNTNLWIQGNAANVALGNIQRDGEVLDDTTSGTTKKLSQALFNDITTAQTSTSTSEVDLMSYTLPANFMGKDGILHIRASGRTTGTTNTRTINFYWGSTAHTIYTGAAAGIWSADIYIHQLNNRASQRLDITSLYGATSYIADGSTDAEDTTASVTIKFTGQTVDASDEVEQRTMFIDSL